MKTFEQIWWVNHIDSHEVSNELAELFGIDHVKMKTENILKQPTFDKTEKQLAELFKEMNIPKTNDSEYVNEKDMTPISMAWVLDELEQFSEAA